MTDESEEWLTIDDIAKLLKLDRYTLYKKRGERIRGNLGAFPESVKIGGAIRIERTVFNAWLATKVDAA